MIEIKAEKRNELGKQAVKKLRSSGFIPATIFGLTIDPKSIKLSPIELTKVVQKSELKKNQIICINIDGENDEVVMIKDVDFNLTNNRLNHVDFIRISDAIPVIVPVPVTPQGTAKGQKLGGVLVIPKRTVLIQSLPKEIPVSIPVDISDLGIGESIRAMHLEIGDGISLVSDKNDVLLKVESTKVSKELSASENEEAVV